MVQVILSKLEYGVTLSFDDLHTLYHFGSEFIAAYDAITGVDHGDERLYFDGAGQEECTFLWAEKRHQPG